ncbi:MAG: 50S ribosomal protein L3 N(5)-glutamine methyltransferase [Cellvibrionales bacterium]|nr:50S ribosomal protein L3 N(5)-glutamine methyltransferase [Cellvibrionales bacterium]
MGIPKNAGDDLSSIRDFLRFGVTLFESHGLFYGHGTSTAFEDASVLIAHALNLPLGAQAALIDPAFYDAKLLHHEKSAILALYNQRAIEKIPVPYITHKAYFCDLAFYVNHDVLIPRSPIAELIKDQCKPYYYGPEPSKVLDLCAGSGCIGISAACYFAQAEVTLSDISDKALAVAAKNVADYELDDRIHLVQSDLFEHIQGTFDIILTNPPYVDAEDLGDMPEEYHHEPEIALASGMLGLDHPLKILREAHRFLTDTGLLIMEVGNSAGHLASIFPDVDFHWVELHEGGHGVLAISQLELEALMPLLESRLSL